MSRLSLKNYTLNLAVYLVFSKVYAFTSEPTLSSFTFYTFNSVSNNVFVEWCSKFLYIFLEQWSASVCSVDMIQNSL